MRRRRFLADEPPPCAPEWMVTYSDMISLLVTFFVMLMSFSTLDEDEAMVVVGAFGSDSGGIVESQGRPTAVDPPRYDRMSAVHAVRGADRPHARPPEELPHNLAEMGQRRAEDELEIDFAAAPDGLAISFGARASFEPDSAELPLRLRHSLEALAEVLRHYAFALVVEGHADPSSDRSGERGAFELSAARARAAVEALLAGGDLERELVQIAAFGAERPRADAGDPANRRVEVRVLALGSPTARLRTPERAPREAAHAEEGR
jgi:chemotaxis protein MotB